ncbi:MAG: protease modulator HflC [Deltaproteobacteria bacterium]|nr:MAG: protease modulator HflC [Deltaproteobacteria bacterium]
MKIAKLGLIIVVILAVFIFNGLYVVDQTQQAMVLQLGKPVKVVKDPGLNVKIPFLQQVTYFDRRLLHYDAAPAEIITSDKKNLVIDNYSKWRIADPLKFFQSVRTEVGAQSRLDDIIYSQLRVELGKETLIDIVSKVREEIMHVVTVQSNAAAAAYGIEVLDVRIKAADLPRENEKHVFTRMQAERQRQAKRYRSEGEEKAMKIRSRADRERTIIISEAYKESEKIKGEGEQTAIKIAADAYGQDPEFYAFYRSLQAYTKSLGQKTTVVMDRDGAFLSYFK